VGNAWNILESVSACLPFLPMAFPCKLHVQLDETYKGLIQEAQRLKAQWDEKNGSVDQCPEGNKKRAGLVYDSLIITVSL